MNKIQQMVSQGYSRTQINSFYYLLYKDEVQADVRQIASLFFEQTKDTLFKQKVVDKLSQHLLANEEVVLVSGAMPDILYPIAKYLGVNQFLCSTPEVINGKYTGVLIQQAIGEGKAKLIHQYAKSYNVELELCYAYGDHISDSHMLNLVGFPYIVDPDTNLSTIATQNSWEVLIDYQTAGFVHVGVLENAEPLNGQFYDQNVYVLRR